MSRMARRLAEDERTVKNGVQRLEVGETRTAGETQWRRQQDASNDHEHAHSLTDPATATRY